MLERLLMPRGLGLPGRLPTLESLLDDFWGRAPAGSEPIAYPVVDVRDDGANLVVEAELPGLEAKDLDLSMENNTLIIKGEKRRESEEKKDNYHRMERGFGSFCRYVALPSAVDRKAVAASFKDGVLKVTLPKTESETARRIAIQS